MNTELKCPCGNEDPDAFLIRETRYVYLQVVVEDGGSVEPGDWEDDYTFEHVLWCRKCASVVGSYREVER